MVAIVHPNHEAHAYCATHPRFEIHLYPSGWAHIEGIACATPAPLPGSKTCACNWDAAKARRQANLVAEVAKAKAAVEPEGVQYPDITVHLSTGVDGNAAAVIAKVAKVLRRRVSGGASTDFRAAALGARSYDDLLQLVGATVNVT